MICYNNAIESISLVIFLSFSANIKYTVISISEQVRETVAAFNLITLL